MKKDEIDATCGTMRYKEVKEWLQRLDLGALRVKNTWNMRA
jgi:hypothetical protein